MRAKSKAKTVHSKRSKTAKRQPQRTASKKTIVDKVIDKASNNAAWEVIYATVERIPRGRVSTYGVIAQVAGLPRRARLVGTALKHVSRTRNLPWYRVIAASGRFAFPVGSDAYRKQQQYLQREGVSLDRGRVNLQKYGWPNETRVLDEVLWRIT